ncbi:anti-sigma factor [Microbacterium amylolyticum]|uniref:Regulator of SigK n=1 Tax=Microbacterium amylolyticum TaxID=936337 RepID=A0ABS4ZGY9_9MICO|nr:anti-sigma factor [Microbacterium amylolyticum]MBP2436554.1 anti-sigma-K factor RskA [Microbacterium amylolyticum]
MNAEELAQLLAGRALHALSPEDERRLDAALAADPELHEKLARDEETAAALAAAAPEVAPPAHIRDALLAQIAATSNSSSASDDDAVPQNGQAPTKPARRSARRAWFTLAASVAVVGVAWGGTVLVSQVFERPAAVIALDRITDAADTRTAHGELPQGGTVQMHWSHSVGEVVVLSEDVPPLDEGQQYELWLVRGETPIPAGVFDGGTSEPILLAGELEPGDIVAITIEQAGGSPTGLPTTDPIAAMPTE